LTELARLGWPNKNLTNFLSFFTGVQNRQKTQKGKLSSSKYVTKCARFSYCFLGTEPVFAGALYSAPICCHSVKTKFCELQAENLMLEAFGTCLPTNRAGELFIQTYLDRKEPT
jgi:hypothetical protein